MLIFEAKLINNKNLHKMNNTVIRKPRVANGENRIFRPSFNSIINEIMHAPSHSDQKNFTKPAANIVKDDEAVFHVSIAIPGVDKNNVDINIEKNLLTIKSNVEESEETTYRLREFNYTNFERSFTLSEDVDIDNISAKFDNGILTVSVPTLEEAGPKKIEIA